MTPGDTVALLKNIKRHFYGSPPVVRNALVVLVATYVFFALLGRTVIGYALYQELSLQPELVFQKFQIWRLVSYALLHDLSSPMHLFFNGLMLYFIGSELEFRWGSQRFLVFAILTTIGGSIFVCSSWLMSFSAAPVVGFSASTVGLLIAWGLTFPTRSILAFGVIPLSGQQIVWSTIGVEILYSLSSSNISSAAHFGGMAMAAILTLGLWRPSRLRALLTARSKTSFR